ncbi:MAG: hypothetical protein ACM31C_00590 [Acidobacteriota bacterium]
MNRRTFLLAIGATACGAKRPPKPPHKRRRGDPIDDDDNDSGGDAPRPTRPDRGDVWGLPPTRPYWYRLATHDERLAQRRETELRLWDLRTMRRTDTLATAYHDACFLADGRLAALHDMGSSPYPELHLIDPRGAIDVRTGQSMMVDTDTELLPADSGDAIYVTEHSDLVYRADLGGGHFQFVDVLKVADRDPLTSLGDGRLVTTANHGALRVLAFGKPELRLKTPAWPILIAPLAGSRAWLTLLYPDAFGAQILLLIRLVDPLVTEARIDVSPGRIFDLATAGGAAAVIVDTQGRTAWERAIVVYEENGKERWRVSAPVHGRAHLAMSKERVVYSLNDGTLLAWDAATGAAVAVTT